MTERSGLNLQELRGVVRSMGVASKPVCVHASMRAIGRVEGGADALIDAFLAEGCTLLVPTFSWNAYAAAPPENISLPARNGTDDRPRGYPAPRHVFTPESNEIDVESMGMFAVTLLRRPERVRGDHPLCSFSALGPLASDVVTPGSADDVFAPLKRLAALDGILLLAGVGLDKLTAIHLAEQLAGRRMFIRWAAAPDGVRPVRVGGCSDGFERLGPELSSLERRGSVGAATWRCYPAAALLARATETIAADPRITMCSDPACLRCADAVAGGPEG